MFLIRKQFNKLIIEQKFCSETQAILVAHKSYLAGSWHTVKVINLELDRVIVELGTDPSDAHRNIYAQTI